MPDIILASGSRYRAELLARLGLPFRTQSPDIDESPRPGENPAALAERLSREKARAIGLSLAPGSWVIGSDQVADCGGHLLGKPGTVETACAQLQLASGKTVTFWTGLALVESGSGRFESRVVRCDVDFRELSTAEINRYVAAEQPLDCAGSFKSEGLGISLFRAIRTDDPTALVGLPLIALSDLLRLRGIALP